MSPRLLLIHIVLQIILHSYSSSLCMLETEALYLQDPGKWNEKIKMNVDNIVEPSPSDTMHPSHLRHAMQKQHNKHNRHDSIYTQAEIDIKAIAIANDDDSRRRHMDGVADAGGKTKRPGKDKSDTIYASSNGVAVNRVNQSDYYVAQEIRNSSYIEPNPDDVSIGKLWRVAKLPKDSVNDYLLPDEVLSMERDDSGYPSNLNFCMSNKMCCLGSETDNSDYKFEKLSRNLLSYNDDNFMLRNWYFPPNNRETRSIVDSLDLIIQSAEKMNQYPQLLIIGDSLSQETYQQMICSIQRTLGARVTGRSQLDLLSIDKFLRFFKKDTDFAPRYFDEVEVEINTTARSSNANSKTSKIQENESAASTGSGEIKKMKISFLKHFKIYIDSRTKTLSHVFLKLACGLPFEYRQFNETTKQTTNTNLLYKGPRPTVIIVNIGAHYKSFNAYDRDVKEIFKTAKECYDKKNVHVVFREPFAQHFRYSYGGYFNGKNAGNLPPSPDLRGRPTNVLKSTDYCAPLLSPGGSKMNQWFQSIYKDKKFRRQMAIISGNEVDICRNQATDAKVDYISLFSSSSYFWKSHDKSDCTHYLYSPGLFLPFADRLYISLFRKSLDVGVCSQLPNNAFYTQGPKGIIQGQKQGHSTSFFPQINSDFNITAVNLQKTFLAPIYNFNI